MSKSSRYLVGIDLGTTHTVVAYADVSVGVSKAKPVLFEIDQLVAAGEVARRKLLPSFRYHPAVGEISDADIALPWGRTTLRGDVDQVVVGEWARDLGSKVEGRQVASAKSWLSHDHVDRTADILPWDGAEGVEKVSPVLASASYLAHVRAAWNYRFPNDPIEQQEITITVPASFDEAARALTVTAAKYAGLAEVSLIEEPQAVVYDWYYRHKDTAQQCLEETKLLLVCDVGGGTTDLSLIQVKEVRGQLSLSRIGVGDHLMLGGDNVDLALAHQAEKAIAGDGRALRLSTLAQLIQQSRQAKEALMSEDAPAYANVTVLGSGAKLVGGAKTATLARDDVQSQVLDGFFANTELGDLPSAVQSGVVSFGLPYAKDPSIPKHIAQFLGRYKRLSQKALGESEQGHYVPDSVLFNGGVFNSPLIKGQLTSVLASWRGEALRELENGNPDLAVAYGAVGFGLSQKTGKFSIGGGAAHSFFLDLGDQQGICLLPRGTEKGEEVLLASHTFSLRLGEPVSFALFSASNDERYFPGQVVACDGEGFKSLPSLVTSLECTMDGASEVDVVIVCYLTEIGTVKMQCASIANPLERWDLEFEIKEGRLSTMSKVRTQADPSVTSNLPPNFSKVKTLVEAVYGSSKKGADAKQVKRLRKDLEAALGKKEKWPIYLLRAMFVELSLGAKRRRRSKDHERNWFNLAGYTLRPGVGFDGDYEFIQSVLPLYESGLQFGNTHQAWAEWWSFWRRIAPGLPASMQIRLLEDVAKFINPVTARNSAVVAEGKKKAVDEMIRLAGSLEHLPSSQKQQLGRWLHSRLGKEGSSDALWWALGRVGGRVLVGGSTREVLSAELVEEWLVTAMQEDWKLRPAVALSAVMMSRRCGDRMLDVSVDVRRAILDKLKSSKAPASWLGMVETISVANSDDAKKIYGESIPAGLVLLGGVESE